MKALKFEVTFQGALAEQSLDAAWRRNDTALEMITAQLKGILAVNLASIINGVFRDDELYAGLHGELVTMGHSIKIEVGEALNIQPRPPAAVRQALEHVRSFHPEIDRVTFKPNGEWEYSADGDAPEGWADEIDMRVIQAASDAVNGPAVFFVLEG